MKYKVRLVDDDDLVLACLERMLSRHFQLEAAPGPWEALHAVSTKGPFAVVVSDMRMPGLNGLQFLAKAKELVPDTIGILLSGNPEDVEAEVAGNDLVFKVLSKPTPYDELIKVITEAIEHRHEC